MKKTYKSYILSFVISFIYVGLGTLVVLVSFPDNEILGFNYNHPLWTPLLIITLPANILLFGLMMVENSLLWIGGLQIIVFFIHWVLIYTILRIINMK